MKKTYSDIPEGQVHYLTEGMGDPLLLLHQTVFSSDEYADVIPFLSGRYHMIAMDTLGYGNSDKPPSQYTVEDYGRSIIHFLDALGINKTNIAGHHTGATLAIEVATTHPERVDKLVLSGVSLYNEEERKKIMDHPMFDPIEIADDGSFLMQLWNFHRNAAPDRSPEMNYRRMVADLLAGPRMNDGHYASVPYDRRGKLPMIQNPTLVMCGTNDMFYNKLDEVHALVPGSAKHIIEGGGNGIAFEMPQEFAQAILDFFG
jgi:pimeloyl-ACP methyl ester carboxylesterase